MNFKTLLLAATILANGLSFGAETARINDPQAFVSEVYRRLASNKAGPPGTAVDIYTPRLKALFANDLRQSKGEVGCLGFVFWVNGQDWSLRDVHVTSRDVVAHPDRKMVVATFINDVPQEIPFDFRRVSGRWFLNDAEWLKGMRWTLSAVLSCRRHNNSP
jgi:hypothetical protein